MFGFRSWHHDDVAAVRGSVFRAMCQAVEAREAEHRRQMRNAG